MRRIKQRASLLAHSLIVLSLAACASIQPGNLVNPASRNQALREQIFLDGANFGPGVVDGKSGEFTRKAMALYREAHALPADWQPDTSGISPYSSYTITSADIAVLGVNNSGPEAQSKQEKMPYTSLAEFLSERFHTTQKFLRGLNPGLDLNALAPGTTISVPNITGPFNYQRYPSGYPAPSPSVATSRHVVVDLQQKMLQVQQDGVAIAAFPITPGSSAHPAPVGEWRIVGSVPWPWYRYDDGVLSRGERTDDFYNLPPGPNNPVGILWAGLNRPGVGIHGSPVPDTIGRAGSHGCIRLSNWDAATFHSLIGKNTPVTIR